MISDLWLSSKLQKLYNETKNKETRTDIREAYLRFEESLTDKKACCHINKKIFVSELNGSSCWRASEPIDQGELLISESAACWDVIHINRSSCEATLSIWKLLMVKSERNKKLRRMLKNLYPRNNIDVNKIKTEAYRYKIPYLKIKRFHEESREPFRNIKLKEALRLFLVVKFNQMNMNMLPELWKTTFKWSRSFNVNGLFLNSSYFDHSCDPNVARFYIGTMAVFRATRNISPNEVLSISYIENENMHEPLWIRYCELNFWCLCDKCKNEIKENSPNMNISEAIKISKKKNPRYTLYNTDLMFALTNLDIKDRIILSEEIIKKHFVSPANNSSKLVFIDVTKIIYGLVFDYIRTKNFGKSIKWLTFLVENSKVRDEMVIPLYLFLGVLIRMTRRDFREANLHFQKAIMVFKTIFGRENVKFFMKRYWGDIRFAIKGSNYFIKNRRFFSQLRQVSLLLRTMFSP